MLMVNTSSNEVNTLKFTNISNILKCFFATSPLDILSDFTRTLCLLMPSILLCTNNATSSRCCLSHEESFNKVKNFFKKIACYSVCDNYGVNSDEIWMNGSWFYTTDSI